jgi:hypothetical protein
MTSKIPLRVQELVRDPRVGYSKEDLVGPLAFRVRAIDDPSLRLPDGRPITWLIDTRDEAISIDRGKTGT